MYVKFKNLKNGKEFTVSATAAEHYKGDKKFQFLGTSDENGIIKERSAAVVEDLGSIEDQLKSVRINLDKEKKSPVEPADQKGQDKSKKADLKKSEKQDLKDLSEEEEDDDDDQG